jgi:tRNA threonylcarbamoyladenosine biosynthesis protein TsaB
VLVLGFDTAAGAVSAALHDGDQVVAAAFTVDARRHTELLTPMIAKVLADAGAARGDLTAVAVGVGPGPYTGLRVGVMTARVLGSVLDVPVYGVCSLDVIAAAVTATDDEFLVATDARRKEVYWARYDPTAAGPGGTARKVARSEGPAVGRADAIPGGTELAVAGAGGQLYREAFATVIGPAHPDARTLCEIVVGHQAPLLQPEPLYLRRPDAREPGPPKRVTPP